jgi:RHS repeat-associated protein
MLPSLHDFSAMKYSIRLYFFLAFSLARLCGQEGWNVTPPQPAQPTTATYRAFALTDSSTWSPPSDFSFIHEATPEISALAGALNNDPIRIFEWVRNNVVYVPYRGIRRGAHLTMVDRAGNDADQAALLIALLKASGSSAISNLQYGFGIVTHSISSPNDSVDVCRWVGVSNATDAVAFFAPIKYANDANDDVLSADGSQLLLRRVWVECSYNGSTVILDPAYKASSWMPAFDLTTAIPDYDGTKIHQVAGGTDRQDSGGWVIYNLETSKVRQQLGTYTSKLHDYLSTQAEGKSAMDLVGGGSINFSRLQSMPTGQNSGSYSDSNNVLISVDHMNSSWDTFVYKFKLRLRGTSQEKTWYIPQLRDHKLAVFFSGTTGQVWLDDAQVTADDGTTMQDALSGNVTVDYFHGFYASSYLSGNQSFTRGTSVAIVVCQDHTEGRLANALEQQAKYVDANMAATDRELATQNVEVLGLQYLALSDLWDRFMFSSNDATIVNVNRIGFFTQNASPGVDVRVINTVFLPRKSQPLSRLGDINRAGAFVRSALEHGVLQQLVGPSALAYSTSRAIEMAADVSNTTNLVWLANYSCYQSAKQQNRLDIESNISASAAQEIATELANGGKILVPARYIVPFNTSALAAGYMLHVIRDTGDVGSPYNGSIFYTMGGAMGGAVATPAKVDSAASAANTQASATKASTTVATKKQEGTAEPIDLTNGAYYYEHTDLSLGGGGATRSLALTRYYNSALRTADHAGIGKGWTHSYDMRAQRRIPTDLRLDRASPAEVAPLVVAARCLLDTYHFDGTAKHWVLGCVIANWTVDQLLYTRVAVAMGTRTLEFVQRPDGSFAGTSNLQATLSADGSGYALQYWNADRIHFRASDGRFDSITDPYGRQLNATYDSSGRLKTVSDAAAHSLTFSYTGAETDVTDNTGVGGGDGRKVTYNRDGYGNFSYIDPEGKTTLFKMDANNRLVELVDGRNRTIATNLYDDRNHVVEQRAHGDLNRSWTIGIAPSVGRDTDPAGNSRWVYFDARGRKIVEAERTDSSTSPRISLWSYDGADRLISTTTPGGNTRGFQYDAYHVLILETDPLGHSRTITPDAQHRPWIVGNFNGKSTTYTYNDAVTTTTDPDGNTSSTTMSTEDIATITEPGNIVTRLSYDTQGRLINEQPAFQTAPTVYSDFDVHDQAQTVTYPDNTVEKRTFTPVGDMETVVDRAGKKIGYSYNNRRQRTTITRYFRQDGDTSATGPTGTAVSSINYDDAGVVAYTVDEMGRKTSVDNNVDSKPTTMVQEGIPGVTAVSDQLSVVTNGYNNLDQLETATDALGHTTTYNYYPDGRDKKVTAPAAESGAVQAVLEFKYDADGNRSTTLTPLQFETTTSFDARGLKQGYTDPLNNSVSYAYDDDGRMITLDNRRSQRTDLYTFSWIYDDDNRTVSSSTPLGKTAKIVRNSRGLVETVTKPSNQLTTYTSFDNEGRVLTKVDGLGETTFTYWPNGLLKSVTDGGRTTYREYDDFNRLTRYDDGEGNTLRYAYWPDDKLKEITYPDGVKKVTYTYDDFGRLKTVTDWAGRETKYTYDMASRLQRIDRPNRTSRVLTYYDNDRLKQIQEYTQSGIIIYFERLTYDLDGRIKTVFSNPAATVPSQATDAITFDKDNRIDSWNGQTVVHDDDGNMKTGPLPNGSFGSYEYDVRNRLVSAGGGGYRYNADDLRVEVTGSGAATFVVDPNAALSHTLVRMKGGAATYYIYGYGLLYEYSNSSIWVHHYDHLGSTVALTGNDGNTITDRISYGTFGNIAQRIGNTDTPFLLHGEMGVMLEDNSLYYMRARYYNPRIMRFVNADPAQFGGGLNWYAFAMDNPVLSADPSGLGPTFIALPGISAENQVMMAQESAAVWHSIPAQAKTGFGNLVEGSGMVASGFALLSPWAEGGSFGTSTAGGIALYEAGVVTFGLGINNISTGFRQPMTVEYSKSVGDMWGSYSGSKIAGTVMDFSLAAPDLGEALASLPRDARQLVELRKILKTWNPKKLTELKEAYSHMRDRNEGVKQILEIIDEALGGGECGHK